MMGNYIEIMGSVHDPSSSYILVLRGINEGSYRYFDYHVQHYPTWGLIIFPAFGQTEAPPRPSYIKEDAIHLICCKNGYSELFDTDLIDIVKREFPEYNEDGDPKVVSTVDSAAKTSEDFSREYMVTPTEEAFVHKDPKAVVVARKLVSRELSMSSAVDHIAYAKHSMKIDILNRLADTESLWETREIEKEDGSIEVYMAFDPYKG